MSANAKTRKLCLILLNILPLVIFAGFYQYGGNVCFYMLPALMLFTVINVFLSLSTEEFLVYNVVLLLSTILGIFVSDQLYFKYVCYDLLGEAVLGVEILAVVLLLSAYTAIELLFKSLYDKKKRTGALK